MAEDKTLVVKESEPAQAPSKNTITTKMYKIIAVKRKFIVLISDTDEVRVIECSNKKYNIGEYIEL